MRLSTEFSGSLRRYYNHVNLEWIEAIKIAGQQQQQQQQQQQITKENKMMFMLYAKTPENKRFHPLNYTTGEIVINKINATLFSKSVAEKIRKDIPELERINTGWKFELRSTK